MAEVIEVIRAQQVVEVAAKPQVIEVLEARGATGDVGPLGPQGDTGEPGLTWQGDWDPAGAYVPNDAVTYGGSSWRATAVIAATDVPPSADARWEVIAQEGEWVRMTQADYNALAVKDPQVLYVITDADSTGPPGPPGPQGPPGPPGAVNAVYSGAWTWRTAEDASGSGQISTDQATDWQATTIVYLNEVTSDGKDTSLYLDRIAVGDEMFLQVQNDASVFQRFRVAGLPVDNGGWRSIQVTLVESGGTVPRNNTAMALSLLRQGALGLQVYSTATHAAGTTISVPQSSHGLAASRWLLVQVLDQATGVVEQPQSISISATGDVTVAYAASVPANSKRVTIVG